MIKFDCKYHFDGNRNESSWQCAISRLVYFGSHLEFVVQTYEPVSVVVGKTSSGFFVYFRTHVTGMELPSLFDIRVNVPLLSSVCFDEHKAATVAFAIKRVGHLLSQPRRKRNISNNVAEDTPFRQHRDKR